MTRCQMYWNHYKIERSIPLGESARLELSVKGVGNDGNSSGALCLVCSTTSDRHGEGSEFGLNEPTSPGFKDGLWVEFETPALFANSPAVQAAKTAVDKAYPGVWENATLFSRQDSMSWSSGMLLEDAVKAGGLTPPLTFTAGQPHNASCWFAARVQGGVPSLVNSGTATLPERFFLLLKAAA